MLLTHGVILPETRGNERPWTVPSLRDKTLTCGSAGHGNPTGKNRTKFPGFLHQGNKQKASTLLFLGGRTKGQEEEGT